MKPIAWKDIDIKGELAVRSGLNFVRLEGEWYRPDEVFKADSHGWPADWEGRTILALTLAARATHRTAAYLDEIMERLPEHLNEKGYLGPVLPDGVFDEQHVSGHSWILRGLAEYYYAYKNTAVKNILERMVRNFLLPIKGHFSEYPIEPGKRFENQNTWRLSQLQTKTKHHAETSDAGCAFIMIDGATAAYELLGWPELKEICEEIIARYQQMDFEALYIQTHATLSGARGILRFYEITGEKKYLDEAVSKYALYKRAAWTEAFGNYNWFGAPRWTEPCAIIDSFIVAVTLWKHTGDTEYLHDAHKIYYNAVCHGNRFNGSFGSDRCLGAKETDDRLFLTPINFETYWCCTMRGGEGFARAVEYNFFVDENTATIPFYNSCTALLRFANGTLKLEESTQYPYYGKVCFTCLESDAGEKTLRFYLPEFSEAAGLDLRVNGTPVKTSVKDGFFEVGAEWKPGDVISFDLHPELHAEDANFENSVSGYHKFMFGPVLLGLPSLAEINSLDGNRFENYAESKYKSAQEISLSKDTKLERVNRDTFKIPGTEATMEMICSVRKMTKEDTMRQVLFQE